MKIRWVATVAIIVIILGVTAALSLRTQPKVTTSSDQALNYYLAGIESHERLYNSEALENFEAAVKLDSSFASAWAHLSKIYFTMGMPEEGKLAAKEAYKLAVDLPERERLNITLLTASIRGNKEELEATLELMLDRYPKEFEPHYYKANMLWERGKLEEAIAEFNEVLSLNPNYALAYNSLGYLHAQTGNYQKAIEYLKKYIFIAPNQANPHDSLGEVYLMIGRYNDALDHFQRAISVKPNLAIEPGSLGCAIYIHKAKALYQMGRVADALSALAKADELGIGVGCKRDIYLEKARIYTKQKQFKTAIDLLTEVDEFDYYNPRIASNLGYIYCELDKPEEIEKLIVEERKYFKKRVIKCSGGDDDISEEEIAAHLTTCDYCNNSQVYKKYLQLFANCFKHEYEESLVLIDEIKEIVVLSDSKNWLQYLSAKTYNKMGQPEKALTELGPIIAINPNNTDYILLTAEALRAVGDNAGALDTLNGFISFAQGADPDWVPKEEALALRAEINEQALEL